MARAVNGHRVLRDREGGAVQVAAVPQDEGERIGHRQRVAGPVVTPQGVPAEQQRLLEKRRAPEQSRGGSPGGFPRQGLPVLPAEPARCARHAGRRVGAGVIVLGDDRLRVAVPQAETHDPLAVAPHDHEARPGLGGGAGQQQCGKKNDGKSLHRS